MVDNELHSIEGFMDTGAGVSIMKKSKARILKLDYRHDPPRSLRPFGAGSVNAIGFVSKVPLRTGCQKLEFEDFYVVADDHFPEKNKDAYLSLSLIQRLKHIVRPVCVPCDL